MQDLAERHVIGAECFGPHEHLVLFYLAADRDDLCHSLHGQEPLPDLPVRSRAYFHRRAGVAGEADEQDLAHDRGDGGQHRGIYVFRQLGSDQLKLFADDLPGAENVRTPIELHPYDADALCRTRPYTPHPRGAIDRRLGGEGDEQLHLFGGHTVCFRQHRDRRSREIREDVHRHGQRGIASEHQEQGRGEERHDPVIERPFDDTF